MDQPTTPPVTPYVLVGGADVVAAIVNRFYDLIDQNPEYKDVRSLHGDLGPIRESLIGFLTGWMGGPRDWFSQGKCIMSLHGQVAIAPDAADQWAAAMDRAISEQGLPDANLAKQMSEVLGQMARGMINRAATRTSAEA